MRVLPILFAFALGALASRWMLSHEQVVRETTVVKHDATESVRTEVVDDSRIGIPPDSVTPSRPAPNAGQRRALTKALERLANEPTQEDEPHSSVPLVELGNSIRAHLEERMREGVAP